MYQKILAALLSLLFVFIYIPTVAFADESSTTTDTVGTIVVDPPHQTTTGGSQTDTKTEEEIHDEKIDSEIENEFDNLFPDGLDPDQIQSWIDSEKDSIFTADRVTVDKTFLEMYLQYLKSLIGNYPLADKDALKKTIPLYYKGDTETYHGSQKGTVSAGTIAEDLGITYDEAALQALIEYLQWLYDGALDGMMPDIDSVYGSDLFEQLGISSIDLDALIQAGIDSGIIRDDLGDGLVFPGSIEDLEQLLQDYLDKLNSGQNDGLLLYKVTEYSVESFTHKHIVQKTPTGNYIWNVSPGGVSKTTDTNTLRIMFQGPGDYHVEVSAICDVTEGDLISGLQKDYWILCNSDGTDGIVIRASSKEFTSAVRAKYFTNRPLRLRTFIRNVTQSEANSVVVMDENGNIMSPSSGFTTQRQ